MASHHHEHELATVPGAEVEGSAQTDQPHQTNLYMVVRKIDRRVNPRSKCLGHRATNTLWGSPCHNTIVLLPIDRSLGRPGKWPAPWDTPIHSTRGDARGRTPRSSRWRRFSSTFHAVFVSAGVGCSMEVLFFILLSLSLSQYYNIYIYIYMYTHQNLGFEPFLEINFVRTRPITV